MKKIMLFLLGLSPFLLGFIMNSVMMQNQNLILPYKLIGITFILFWGFIGFKTCGFGKTPLGSAVIANLPAFFVLILNLYQEIVLGQYWFNIFGIATQFYYLPLINLSSTFAFWTPYVWVIYIAGFLLMLASYCTGVYLKKRSML